MADTGTDKKVTEKPPTEKIEAPSDGRMLKNITKGYQGPNARFPFRNMININAPLFHRSLHIPQMLKDPRVSFGIKLIKGPILSKAGFVVETEDQELHD